MVRQIAEQSRRTGYLVVGQNACVGGHVLYLVGGPPRVGKSSLAQRLLETDGIPWLPTDVIRTVLRRVVPELDAIDQDPVDAAGLAELIYAHIEQAAEVCAEEECRESGLPYVDVGDVGFEAAMTEARRILVGHS